MTDPRDELVLIVSGIQHSAEAIRTAIVGWHPPPRPGFGADGMDLCAELYACAGRYESRLRALAAVDESNAALIRAIRVDGENACGSGDAMTAESLIALPEIGTYIVGAHVPVADRIALLAQALGIVEAIIVRRGAAADNDLLDFKNSSLEQLCERIRCFAEDAGHS